MNELANMYSQIAQIQINESAKDTKEENQEERKYLQQFFFLPLTKISVRYF